MQVQPVVELSNWGRWGANDERGTLNWITPELILKAARLVKKGKVYSLSLEIHKDSPCAPHKNTPWKQGVVREDHGPTDRVVFQDFIMMNTHGVTHVDPLCHVTYGRKMYNGFPIDGNAGEAGALKCGIDKVVSIVGRGVLLDMARYKGVEHLPFGYAITPADLDGCARAEGVEIGQGDILLLRTGYLPKFDQDRSLYGNAPGIGRATLPWLAAKRVTGVGADTVGVEVKPPEDPSQPS
ncbi:MAG: cyclase family protein, partial [Chloroflexota bacterium]